MKRLRTISALSILLILLLALPFACNGEPDHKANSLTESGILTIAAYGDTRPTWWPFAKQESHAIVAKEISAHKPDAVLFTGDMVLFNLQGAPYVEITEEWQSFYTIVSKYFSTKESEKKPAFYPTLGNHELLTWQWLKGLIDVDMLKNFLTRDALLELVQGTKTVDQLVDALLGDFAKIDLTKLSDTRRDALKNMIVKNINALYSNFNMELTPQKRSEISWNVMQQRIAPQHPYLKTLLNEEKKTSWYYFDRKVGGYDVRFICLNSNARGNPDQMEWFKKTCEGFNGPIIVYAHHPIYSMGEHSMETASVEFRKEYAEPVSKYATLYISGHEHNYQRLCAADPSKGPIKGPVFIITGGGGAPIKDNKEMAKVPDADKPHPEDWNKFLEQKYNFITMTFSESGKGLDIKVDAYGWQGEDKPEGKAEKIESFDVLWQP